MNKAYVYVVGGDYLIEKMMVSNGYTLTDHLPEAEVVVFTGGSDVTPSFYGMDHHPQTFNDERRDLREKEIYEKCLPGQLKVGICRGSQFLCVMNGGALYQDVDNHCRTHDILYTDVSGKDHIVKVTSTHHQMMYPNFYGDKSGRDYDIWGFAAETSFRDFKGTDTRKVTNPEQGPDSEIVFWPLTRTLCFQGHPEYGLESCEDLFFKCVNRAMKR